jgi:hypothetical protein
MGRITPGITAPIVGISKMEQFEDAVAALGLTLSQGDVCRARGVLSPETRSSATLDGEMLFAARMPATRNTRRLWVRMRRMAKPRARRITPNGGLNECLVLGVVSGT